MSDLAATRSRPRRPDRLAPAEPWWQRVPSGAWTVIIAVTVVVAWELSARLAPWWPSAVVPPLTDVLGAGAEVVGDGTFLPDLIATTVATVTASVLGSLIGLALGIGFWKAPLVGRMFEPYLVSFYAVPIVVFYPIALVVLGINRWPIVILATTMAAIPMTVNTWVGLSGIPPVYLRLARSLLASRRTTLVEVALPAAAPLLVSGTTLAAIYALIGVVAMEFMVAQAGLGAMIKYLYEAFDNPAMYFYIFATLVLSVVLVALTNVVLRGALGKAVDR